MLVDKCMENDNDDGKWVMFWNVLVQLSLSVTAFLPMFAYEWHVFDAAKTGPMCVDEFWLPNTASQGFHFLINVAKKVWLAVHISNSSESDRIDGSVTCARQ